MVGGEGEDHCTSEIHPWTVLLCFRIMANDLADGNNKAALMFADDIYTRHIYCCYREVPLQEVKQAIAYFASVNFEGPRLYYYL